jgi:ATP synthase assembly factor FMC1
MSTPTPTTLRSLYRSLLRELPPRTSATPSPLATQLRSTFISSSSTTPTSSITTASLNDATSTSSAVASASGLDAAGATKTPLQKVQEAEQLAMYLKAQRTYVTLVERYNPGMDMSDEERVRLSARRVGMNLPVDYVKE